MAKDPKDSRIMEYKDTISQLNMTIKSQNELIVSLQKTIDSNNEAMAVMNEKIDYLTKKLFGTSGEKSKNAEGQLSLFDEAEQEAGAYEEPEAEGTVVKEHTRKAKGTERAVSFVKAHVPEALIPHSYASASAVAWTMYQKYANSLPLYRQEQDWKQTGVTLSRATLANWVLYCAGNYFSPLYDYFHRELIKRRFLMADETRVQVLKEPERKAETDSFMWLFRTGEDGLAPIILYKYTQTRAGFNAADFLKGFKGYLETDCYQGYNSLADVKRCCCWAHLRRYFTEAVPKGKELDYGNPAAQGVQYCNKLFEYERRSHEKGHTHEQRKEYRLKKEVPVPEAFWEVSAKYSCGFSNPLVPSIIVGERYLDYFTTITEDRLWQLLAKPVFRWRNRSGLSMNAAKAV